MDRTKRQMLIGGDPAGYRLVDSLWNRVRVDSHLHLAEYGGLCRNPGGIYDRNYGRSGQYRHEP